MASIGQITQSLHEIDKQYKEYERELQDYTQSMNEEIRQRFAAYKEQCEELMLADREKTESRFMQELDRSITQIRSDYDARVSSLNKDYSEFCDKITQSNQQLRTLAENALVKQQELSAEYYAEQDRACNAAMKRYNQAYSTVMNFVENRMVKWFPPDNSTLYLEHLRTIQSCIEQQLYQAALGIADSLILSVRIEINRIYHLFHKWLNNCMALKAVLEAESDVVDNHCVCTEGWMDDDLMELLSLKNNMLSDDDLMEWIDQNYWQVVNQYDSVKQQMEEILKSVDISDDVNVDITGVVMKKMSRTTATAPISAESIYSIVKEAYIRINSELEYINTMRTRIQCYGQRYNLTDVIQELLESEGYSGEGCDERKDTVHLRYENWNGDVAELFIIPVLCMDKKWRNCVGYTVINNQGLKKELRELFNDACIRSEEGYDDSGSSVQKMRNFTRLFKSTL